MDRSTDALQRKFEALKTAVKPWRDIAAAGKQFPQHQSQTRAVAALLDGLQRRISTDLDRADREADDDLFPVESRILAAYQIWNVFRSKFAQRLETDLAPFLRAADELAWRCYDPAKTAALGATDPRAKEPPLVYFSSEASPMIDPRAARFQPDGVPKELLTVYGWPEAATRLPFALIGVPWYQTGYLPDALAIAHEVGHAVADDFKLFGELRNVLDASLKKPGARVTWAQWIHEMFADLWGCLALGPSFASTLSDFLWPLYTRHPAVSLAGEYPPAALRVYWNGRVLDQLGFGAEADALWQRWKGDPAKGFAAEFLKDAGAIARAWLDARYKGLGGKKLTQVMTFDAEQEKAAKAQAASALARRADGHSDVRVLWAALQQAYTPAATDVLLRRIVRAASDKPRAYVPQADPKARMEHLERAGESLL